MLAALYDIHGNVAALDAVLADARALGATRFVIGGDVAYGPFVPEALDRLLDLGPRAAWLRGNADRELVEALHGRLPEDDALRAAAAWEAARLAPRHRDRLAALPLTVTLDVPGLGDVRFCHGSPRRDDEILTALTPETRARPILVGVPEATVVCGHTHVPFDRRLAGKRVLNAGSVGMPYGDTAASWLLLGPDGPSLRRTPYLNGAALDAVRGSGHPLADGFARTLADPPDALTVAEHFEGRADS